MKLQKENLQSQTIHQYEEVQMLQTERRFAANIKKVLCALLVLLFIPAFGFAKSAEEEDDARLIAKVLWTECRGVEDTAQQAAVVWCILNRVDHEDFPDTIEGVVKQKHQFAYRSSAPVTEELLSLAQDVILRWELEKLDVGDVGRVLPEDYLYFSGNGSRNRFRKTYKSKKYWDWSLESPYTLTEEA